MDGDDEEAAGGGARAEIDLHHLPQPGDGIHAERTDEGGSEPQINTDEDFLNLFKEIQTLSWLGIRANVKLRISEDITRSCYIKAMNIRNSLRMYTKLVQQTNPRVMNLAAEYHQNVRDLIVQAVREKLTWQNVTLSSWERRERFTRRYMTSFSRTVYTLQDRVNAITKQVNLLDDCKVQLEQCPYAHDQFAQVMERIQTALDELANLKCANLDGFINDLDQDIEKTLLGRVNGALKTWLIAFKRRQREESCDPIREEDLVAEERDTAPEVFVYDAVMSMVFSHEVGSEH